MSDPLTPSFPVESLRKRAEAYPPRTKEKILSALEKEGKKGALRLMKLADKTKSPQEAKHNRVLVGGKPDFCLYQVHNYRLFVDYDRGGFDPTLLGSVKTPKRLVLLECKRVNHGSEYFMRFKNFGVKVKRSQIQVGVYVDRGKWYRIRITTRAKSEIRERVLSVLRKRALSFVRAFVKFYGGSSELRVLNETSEDPIKRESFVDSIPVGEKWHMSSHKKVYGERKIEAYGSVFAGNFIEARAVDAVAPEIAEALRGLSGVVGEQVGAFKAFSEHFLKGDALGFLKENIKGVGDVLRFRERIEGLSLIEKEDLSLWLFTL